MVALPVLVSGLEAEMIRLGYKDSTMVWYRGYGGESEEQHLLARTQPGHALVVLC